MPPPWKEKGRILSLLNKFYMNRLKMYHYGALKTLKFCSLLKGAIAKNERGFRFTAKNKRFYCY